MLAVYLLYRSESLETVYKFPYPGENKRVIYQDENGGEFTFVFDEEVCQEEAYVPLDHHGLRSTLRAA